MHVVCTIQASSMVGRHQYVKRSVIHIHKYRELTAQKKFGRASKYVNQHAEVLPKFDHVCTVHTAKNKKSRYLLMLHLLLFFPCNPHMLHVYEHKTSFWYIYCSELIFTNSIHFSLGACVHYSKKCMELNSEIR